MLSVDNQGRRARVGSPIKKMIVFITSSNFRIVRSIHFLSVQSFKSTQTPATQARLAKLV